MVPVMTAAGPVLIRDCLPADVAAIAAIYRDAVLYGSASFEIVPPDETEMLRRRDAILSAGHAWLVAERGGGVVGYAYEGPYRARPAYRWTVENSVYVDAAARDAGIGRRLLAALIDAATARGFRQMIAIIGDSANVASQRLHAGAGFAPVGTVRSVGWKHGRWLDSVLMQRALGKGDGPPPADR
jgi:phosphinothricin acetyltransferase